MSFSFLAALIKKELLMYPCGTWSTYFSSCSFRINISRRQDLFHSITVSHCCCCYLRLCPFLTGSFVNEDLMKRMCSKRKEERRHHCLFFLIPFFLPPERADMHVVSLAEGILPHDSVLYLGKTSTGTYFRSDASYSLAACVCRREGRRENLRL